MNILEIASQYGMVALVIIQFLYFIALLVLSTKFAPKSCEKDIDELQDKVRHIEVRLENLPTKEDLHRLENNITELKGDLKGVDEAFDGIRQLMKRTEKQLNLVDQYLRSHS